MEYGRRFKKAFEKARKSVDYWMEDLRLDFLNSLIATIEAKGISQKELGKRLGKSEAYISKVINSNSSNFTLKTMIQLCLALDSKISLKIEDIEPVSDFNWQGLTNAHEVVPVLWGSSDETVLVPLMKNHGEKFYEHNECPGAA
ncbi:MAG: helix-turn-helix domain-containing protein [Aminobacterium colombiense]|jgi:transcriptional regulator with XRE-family HTH domain|uniref:Transcriptional regulator, XRE family n=1 Tax=Aminobacterium colombiense (strain DSM 12261 / ALA-1) TaxID=572547 RepID=D5EET8_AMICL|nr:MULTISPECIES: helix-turn-helix domain-containing protein [Aminobacterium]MDD2378280.1 helix-turn-helix domain-containing protein [Aminobacterium colombiense]ADE57070.1 transcriptional regulator, XRE family [Aminobacterium colombiense DSM 12261]MDD3768799.1 helix-turn-helix domain-containing protein [Aminobacterium colombiense]MDD4266495.1 helix-turn-helix domain-containing protein [Aminobacterium colombiense]MDD4585134.1 helix-turn-helix domain-containing protein [Aminobacterium colombiense